MKTNSFLQTLFIVAMTIGGIAIGIIGYGVAHPNAKPFDAKEHAKENHCPYEGKECPNAQAVMTIDSLAYVNLEESVDSLIDANTALKVQLAGCEFKDHSKITTIITVDTTMANWREYAYLLKY